MTDMENIIVTAAAGLATTGVVAGTGLLVNVALKVSTIAAKLSDHINNENSDRESILNRLDKIEKRLPNGEVEKTYRMVRKLHDSMVTRESPKQRRNRKEFRHHGLPTAR